MALACGLIFLSLLLSPVEAWCGAPGPEEPLVEEPGLSETVSEPAVVPRPIDPFPAPLAPAPQAPQVEPSPPKAVTRARRPILDPSARLIRGDQASEAWTLFIELESGHRITQRFLLSNAGPGDHNAVALGHVLEPGREPYRYENGRTRSNWTLSDDRLFFDISASHLDLHRPKGELRITKDELEIRLFFDFPAEAPSARIPEERLPRGYHVEVLAVNAATEGSIRAPWMSVPLETRGRTWLVHTWTQDDEADLLARRLEIFGNENGTSFYGIHLQGRGDWQSAWSLIVDPEQHIIESAINVAETWTEESNSPSDWGDKDYPRPKGFRVRRQGTPQPSKGLTGPISLGSEFLRFDPSEVIPQPFRWFIRQSSKPQEVWAAARIGVRLLDTPGTPPLPESGETLSAPPGQPVTRSKREIEEETADRSVTGVAFITFLNPTGRR